MRHKHEEKYGPLCRWCRIILRRNRTHDDRGRAFCSHACMGKWHEQHGGNPLFTVFAPKDVGGCCGN
jgi:hypothetical protein